MLAAFAVVGGIPPVKLWVPPSAPLDTHFPGVPCFDSRSASHGCGCQLQVLVHPRARALSNASVFSACGNLVPLPPSLSPAPSSFTQGAGQPQISVSFPAASAGHLYTLMLLDAGGGRSGTRAPTRARVHWLVANVPGATLAKAPWMTGAFTSNSSSGGGGSGVLGSLCTCEAVPAFGALEGQETCQRGELADDSQELERG